MTHHVQPEDEQSSSGGESNPMPQEEFDQAVADYEAAIKRNQQFWMDYINPAVAHSDRGEYDQAIAYYDMMIELNPQDAMLYRARAYAYAEKGENHRAIAELQEAVRLDPQYHDAYIDLAEIYKKIAAACDGPRAG